jgi:translation initiation factor 2B subunit (eIF-2B alpha/beta/delta family)
MGENKFNISKILSNFSKDNTSGANELVSKAIKILENQLLQEKDENSINRVLLLTQGFINSHPSMAPLVNSIGYIFNNLDPINKSTIQERLDELKKYRIEIEKALEGNFQNFLSQYKNKPHKIMLISYSSTIIRQLIKSDNSNLELFILESRPLFEGRRTAEVLSQNFKTHLIIDAAIGKFIDQIDFVLVGVDSILKNGSIINKIGTNTLAVLANSKGVKVFAVADSLKFNLRSYYDKEILIEKKQENEVYDMEVKSDKLEIHNYYFDETPSKYINGIISDLGILTIEEFLTKVREVLPIEWFKYFIDKN